MRVQRKRLNDSCVWCRLRVAFAALILCLLSAMPLASGLKAEKGFRFGTWTYGELGKYPSHDALMKALADTLKFNYLMDTSMDSLRFKAIEQRSLRIAAQNVTSGLKGPYFYSHAHYNVWEAEGNQALTKSLNLQHPARVGSTVADGEVISYKVTVGVDPDTLIQFGPFGYAQDLGFCGVPKKSSFPYYPWTDYFASYRIRVGPDLDPDSNEKVAILYVARAVKGKIKDILDMDTLWDDHFRDSINYIEHTLKWNTKYFYDNYGMYANSSLDPWSKVSGMELRAYWFGKRDLYIDKVTVYDMDGLNLIEGRADDEIHTHIHAYQQTSASLDAWFLREEMECLGDEVDCVKPWRYVRSYLSKQGDKWGVGSISIGKYRPDFQTIQSFMNLIEPEELWMHLYLLKGNYAHSSDYQGEDSLSLQAHWDTLITELSTCNKMCREKNIDFTATLQGHAYKTRCVKDTIKPPDDTLWNWYLRGASCYELECMSNLALAYGAKGVLYWKYFGGSRAYKETVWYYDGESYILLENYLYQFIHGLTDTSKTPTERWYCIKDKIGPYMDKSGPIYYGLTWQAAGSSDTVSSILGGSVNSIKSYEFPDSPYVEVAFFVDSAGAAPDTNYFMLVNRRCLENESQNVTSYVSKEGKCGIIDLYEDDTTHAEYDTSDGAIPFTTHLDPGEGKLFKIVPR